MRLWKRMLAGLVLSGMVLGGPAGGQALVTPEDYQKMQREKLQKTRPPENVSPNAPIKFQIHQQEERRPPTGRTFSK